MRKMTNYHTYTDVFRDYEILKNMVLDEHNKYINQRSPLLGGINNNQEYQNKFVSMLASALSNFIICFDTANKIAIQYNHKIAIDKK